MRNLSRRQFLRSTAAAAGAVALSHALPQSLAAEADAAIPIIDTHQHLWDLDVVELAWMTDDHPLNRNFVSEDYDKAAAGLNIVRTVYMEVDVKPEHQDKEVAYVTRLCEAAEHPMAAAVIGGHPASPGFTEYLARHKNNPHVRGVRQVLHERRTPRGFCLQDEFVAGVRALGRQGWSFDLCMRPDELEDAAALVEKAPDTRFVLDHCGNARVTEPDLSAWKRGIDRVAARPNVIGKISGIIVSGKGGKWSVDNLAPIVNHTLDAFGPDRVVFGGDWPVCTQAATLKQWVESLREIVKNRPEAERRKLFHDNAVAFYRLSERRSD